MTSLDELQAFVARLVDEAGVTRCFVIAGDPSTPKGPFADSLSLIDTGVFERAGIRTIGVAGHPEGHPIMHTAEQWDVLERKCRSIEERGMAAVIVTQFGFDADMVVTWVEALRARGMTHPVRVGVPGPASVARTCTLCGKLRCRRLRVSALELWHLDWQVIRQRRAGSLCRSPCQLPDGSAWRYPPARLSLRRHRPVCGVGCALSFAQRATRSHQRRPSGSALKPANAGCKSTLA